MGRRTPPPRGPIPPQPLRDRASGTLSAVLDGCRLGLAHRAAALVAASATALGTGGMHTAEHGVGESLPAAAMTVAVCLDGRPSQHFDAPRLIEVRPCPACLLARVGIGEPAALPPALGAPAPVRALAGSAQAWIAGPPAHPRRPRGPPAVLTSS